MTADTHTERRLAAIMFTDIVGYTALTARDEEAARRARDRHEAVVRPLVEEYQGQWIERTGDETLSAFPSALDAVNCALAVQEKLDGDLDLQLRVGIHHGDVTFDAAGVSGDGVNVAARVRPMAKPGGSCITGDVHHSVRGRPGLGFEALGEQHFKNVDHPVSVFAVSGTAASPRPASARSWWTRGAAELTPIHSIAVLPLENLSRDPEQEYFADGMTEALIGDLAKIGSLTVISRTSIMQYKDARKPLPEIAKELNVAGIIEGTVMRAGDRVRINVQLIDARNDRLLWSDRYDRDLGDILALHGDVARAVAEQVRLELNPEEQAVLTASRTVDPRAYDAYLRGLQLRGPGFSGFSWVQALEQFERAVELDPGFAEAHVALGDARVWLGSGMDGRYRGEFPRAREAARRALEIDDRLGAAHALLAGALPLQRSMCAAP
jgi:adenylate cyclase